MIQQRDIVDYDAARQSVTFRYLGGRTKQARYRTLPLADFLWRLMIHVLPKGYRRVRDFGFLHGNAKQLLALLQFLLRVNLLTTEPQISSAFRCPECSHNMAIMLVIPGWRPT